jgi:CubicO group peptidase (beta-lactamase class C family)
MRHDRQPSRREVLASGAVVASGLAGLSDLGAADPPDKPAGLPHARPEDIGLDPRRLQDAYALLEDWTKGKDPPVPGGVILVGRRGKIVPPRFFGRQGPEADAPAIRRDAMFLVASISKPVTYLGAMMLVERGLLSLTDPVTRYLPEFARHDKGETLVVHLFTHTSGLPDMLPDNVELRRKHAPLKRFIQGAIRDTKPLFPPGTRLSYQSMGTLVVAEIIQRLSGMTIHDYLRRQIFEPLGLKSTGLGSQGFDRKRLVRVQVPDWQEKTDFGWNSTYWQQLGAPWGGLFSAPEDFAVLCQLMLDGGRRGKTRLLSPAAVRMMTTNRLNDFPDLPEATRRTQPWGLGWRMNHPGTPGSWGDLLGRHVFGHTGATGTMVWMDPETRGFCLLWTNAIRARAPWRLVHLSNAVAASFT